MSQEYVNLLADLEEEKIIELTNKRIADGENPMNILDDTREGMGIVGKRFADGEYFLPELVFSGELLNSVTEIVKPLLSGGEGTKQEKHGKVLIATVAGDIHDIGLNIVEFMLDVNGFEVTSLGVDVPVEKIVEAVKEIKPPVLGLSGFLTSGAPKGAKDNIDISSNVRRAGSWVKPAIAPKMRGRYTRSQKSEGSLMKFSYSSGFIHSPSTAW